MIKNAFLSALAACIVLGIAVMFMSKKIASLRQELAQCNAASQMAQAAIKLQNEGIEMFHVKSQAQIVNVKAAIDKALAATAKAGKVTNVLMGTALPSDCQKAVAWGIAQTLKITSGNDS